MKTNSFKLKIVGGSLLAFAIVAAHAQFTAGNLVVVRVGDGVTTLANSAGPLSLLQYNSGGLVGSPINIPSGNGGLQTSGTATSEGQLTLSSDDTALVLAGYVPPFGGSGSLSGRSSANAPRGYVTIDYNGNVSSTTTLTGDYSAQNIRSGFGSSSSSLWFTGSGTSAGSGLVYYNGTSSTTIQGVNSRVLGYFGGNLYYSTGSGTAGVYKYSGLPTSATTSTAFLTGVTGQGSSPYDFVFSPDGNTLYVADDGIGVQKFIFSGSSWSLAYNFTDTDAGGNKGYGLEVDFSGANPVLYWTTPNDVWTATDSGSGTAGTALLTAGTDYAFRGLAFAPQPVPEPSSLALAGMGLIALWNFNRRNRKA